MARRCGLRPGVTVIAGCGDTAASFLACGATREGIGVDVAGTASVFAATTRCFRPDVRRKVLSCGQAATPGLWHPYAYINGGGMNLEWFRAQVLEGRGAASFEEMNRRAEAVAPADDLPLFIPHLGGRVSPGWPHLRGAWAGLSWSHSSGHLYRAMLEGVALEYALYRKVLLELNRSLELCELRVTGGGAKSAVWNRIKADALGVRIVQIARTEGAPLGAALLAAFGVGLVPDLDRAASRWIAAGRVTQPDRALAPYYRVRLARYERLLAALNDWSQP